MVSIINKGINEIYLNPNNPRKNNKAVDVVANSIKEFGFKVPIVINRDGMILAGNTRYKAAQKLGLEEIPCILADDLSEEQQKAFMDWQVAQEVFHIKTVKALDSKKGYERKGVGRVLKGADVLALIESVAGEFYEGEKIEQFSELIRDIKASDDRVVLNYKWGMMTDIFSQCEANWSVIAIDCKGNVLYCCQRPDDIVGNIMDQDILQKKESYKADMRLCEIPCRLSGANRFIENMKGAKDIEFV